MRTLFLRLILLWTLTLTPFGAFAQVIAAPQLMNFQGRLSKPDGTPVPNGTYAIRFSLHDALSGGAEKWSQTLNSVTVRNGAFAVLLSGFPAATFNGNLWLEIKIGADTPLSPRQQLVSVAYAMKANSVPDGSIGTPQLADNGVTAAKIANNAVTATELLSDAASLAKVSGGALNIGGNRLFVPNGVIQKGGIGLIATTDLGLYSQNSGNWIRFVTNNGAFHWYADSGIGTTPRMTLTPQGFLGIGASDPTAALTIGDVADDRASLDIAFTDHGEIGADTGISHPGDGLLTIYTDNVARMRFTNSARIGVFGAAYN